MKALLISYTDMVLSLALGKYLRENLLYAKLDDELWELLQDAESREYLRESIVKRYLTKQ